MTTNPEEATRDGGSLPDAPGPASEHLYGASRAPRQLMSLRECSERLRQPHELGESAPAHVTLKRWSAGGLLDPAKADQTGRPVYDLAKVRKIVREQLAGRFDSPSHIDSGASEGSAGGTPAAGARAKAGAAAAQTAASQIADVQAINERFDRIEQSILQLANTFQAALGEVMSQVARCAQASESLDSVRRTLQLRTDGELTALRGQVAQAQSATKRSPEGGDQAQALMKLGVELRGMAQRMEDIWSVLDKGHKHR